MSSSAIQRLYDSIRQSTATSGKTVNPSDLSSLAEGAAGAEYKNRYQSSLIAAKNKELALKEAEDADIASYRTGMLGVSQGNLGVSQGNLDVSRADSAIRAKTADTAADTAEWNKYASVVSPFASIIGGDYVKNKDNSLLSSMGDRISNAFSRNDDEIIRPVPLSSDEVSDTADLIRQANGGQDGMIGGNDPTGADFNMPYVPSDTGSGIDDLSGVGGNVVNNDFTDLGTSVENPATDGIPDSGGNWWDDWEWE